MKLAEKIFSALLVATLIFVFIFNYFSKDDGPTLDLTATDLMAQVDAQNVTTNPTSPNFTLALAKLTADLFSRCYSIDQNILISPLSITLALAMCENGAANATLSQMEQLLLNVDKATLNNDLKNYLDSLSSPTSLQINNSIWIRDDPGRLIVNPEFLKTNATYYQGACYKARFDNTTLEDINNYIEYHTKGMIKQALDEIPIEAVLYLINTVLFEEKWASEYTSDMVYPGIFTNAKGTRVTTDFLHSGEGLYLEDDQALGFIKKYQNDRFGFVALLPKGNLDRYLENLDGTKLHELITNARATAITCATPKFKYDYKIELSPVLIDLGLIDAFNETADFSNMATTASKALFISRILHNCSIELNEIGTKAGAVTIVEMVDTAIVVNEKEVILDRPFVYLIYDFDQEVSVFIGAINNL